MALPVQEMLRAAVKDGSGFTAVGFILPLICLKSNLDDYFIIERGKEESGANYRLYMACCTMYGKLLFD